MGLKITCLPLNPPPFTPVVALGKDIKVVHIESGVDISDAVISINISIEKDEWIMANLVCDVGELDLEGVDIESMISFMRSKEVQNGT